jgi:PhzF family phenazine biosynthesis protein
MKAIQIYQVDAFTSEAFKGNPAAVCVLEEPIEDKYVQSIAREMNLSETAFVRSLDGKSIDRAELFSLRWFTPKCEVDLCGHATIATSEVLFNVIGIKNEKLVYETRSGRLEAQRTEAGIALNFPIDEVQDIEISEEILEVMGIKEYEKAIIGKNTRKLVIHVKKESEVLDLSPNFEVMKGLKFNTEVKGLGVTCRGDEKYDFISRYFNPWAGINEDPVTGSVHTLLAAYWGDILNKKDMIAYQASERGGEITLRVLGENKVELIGKAVIVLKGELYI